MITGTYCIHPAKKKFPHVVQRSLHIPTGARVKEACMPQGSLFVIELLGVVDQLTLAQILGNEIELNRYSRISLRAARLLACKI